MYVDTLAETRVGNRVYVLQGTMGLGSEDYTNDDKGGRVAISYRIEILQDEKGAGTHDRFIAGFVPAGRNLALARTIWARLIEVAMHHAPAAFAE